MELQILTSSKGTKAVTALHLHQMLGLAFSNYANDVRKWLRDAYIFKDAVRKPLAQQDFAVRKQPNAFHKDYYLTVELAKQIVLRTNSKYKIKFAHQLNQLDILPSQMTLFQAA